ncbi:MAG: hypothetical protein R2856_25700 [Caldilineaceae bacterium]
MLLLAVLLALLAVNAVLAQDDSQDQEGGYTYTVQPGDYWASVAARGADSGRTQSRQSAGDSPFGVAAQR